MSVYEFVLEISESMNVCLILMSVLVCHECVLDTNVSVLDHEGVPIKILHSRTAMRTHIIIIHRDKKNTHAGRFLIGHAHQK